MQLLRRVSQIVANFSEVVKVVNDLNFQNL